MTNDEIVYTLRCLAELDDDKPSASIVFWAAMMQAEVRKLARRLKTAMDINRKLDAEVNGQRLWEANKGYAIPPKTYGFSIPERLQEMRDALKPLGEEISRENEKAAQSQPVERNEAADEPSDEAADAASLKSQTDAHAAMIDQLAKAGGNFARGSLFGHVYKTQ